MKDSNNPAWFPTHAPSTTSYCLSTGETFKENNNGAIYSYNEQVEITFKRKCKLSFTKDQAGAGIVKGEGRRVTPIGILICKTKKEKAKDERYSRSMRL